MTHRIQKLILLGAAGLCLLTFIASTSSVEAQNGNHAVETGPAKFLRDHDQALLESKKTGKPIFAFFQEVPG